MLTNEEKKQILAFFLEIIEGISNKDYQRRIWILGEGPEVDDFTETTCHFFEEGDSIIEKYADFGITTKQYKILLQFRNEFNTFVKGPRPGGYLPQEFINTAEWTKMTNMAKDVLKAFNYPTPEHYIERKKKGLSTENQFYGQLWQKALKEAAGEIMRIFHDKSDKKLDTVTIYLTKEEAVQLRCYLNQLLDNPKLNTHIYLIQTIPNK